MKAHCLKCFQANAGKSEKIEIPLKFHTEFWGEGIYLLGSCKNCGTKYRLKVNCEPIEYLSRKEEIWQTQ